MTTKSKSEWSEVHVLRDQDGVICVIRERPGADHPYHSFTFMREYERDGATIRTSYLSRRHTAGIRRLMTQLENWLDTKVDQQYAARAR